MLAFWLGHLAEVPLVMRAEMLLSAGDKHGRVSFWGSNGRRHSKKRRSPGCRTYSGLGLPVESPTSPGNVRGCYWGRPCILGHVEDCIMTAEELPVCPNPRTLCI